MRTQLSDRGTAVRIRCTVLLFTVEVEMWVVIAFREQIKSTKNNSRRNIILKFINLEKRLHNTRFHQFSLPMDLNLKANYVMDDQNSEQQKYQRSVIFY